MAHKRKINGDPNRNIPPSKRPQEQPVIEREHRIVELPIYDEIKGTITYNGKTYEPNKYLADTAEYWTTIVSYNGLTEDCYKYLVDLLRIRQYMIDLGYEGPFDFDSTDSRFKTWDKKVEHNGLTIPPSSDTISDMLREAEDRFLGVDRYPKNMDAPVLNERLGEFGDNWYFTQKHCIYMFLLQLAGEWGTSVRFGWLEDTQIDKAIDFMTVIVDTAGYGYEGFTKDVDLDSKDYEGWIGYDDD